MIGRRMRSKGGGPALVVEDRVSDEAVLCTWMNAMGKHKTESFLLTGLEDLDDTADHVQVHGAQLGLGSPVMLVALLQFINLSTERLHALLHVPPWLKP